MLDAMRQSKLSNTKADRKTFSIFVLSNGFTSFNDIRHNICYSVPAISYACYWYSFWNVFFLFFFSSHLFVINCTYWIILNLIVLLMGGGILVRLKQIQESIASGKFRSTSWYRLMNLVSTRKSNFGAFKQIKRHSII